MSFGSRIKEFRKVFNLSQQELAKKLNMQPQALARYEKDKVKPSIELAQKLTNMFNINLNWLLTGRGEMFLKDNPKIAGIVNSEIQNAAIAGHNGVAIAGNNNTITSNLSNEDKMIQELITAFKKLPKRLQRGYYFKILGDAELYSEDEDNDRN